MEAFWNQKSLEAMSNDEWESLCDGCAQCCLHKLEDEDTGTVYVTQIVCQLIDLPTCQCSDYKNRSTLVPTCVTMKPKDARNIQWMPMTCAYRLLAENKPLPAWHPLVSGSKKSVIDAGISIMNNAIPENDIPESDWPDYIVDEIT